MKKILFCIYIIITCTYLHPAIAASCQAFFIADPDFDASEMLTINGDTYNTGLKNSEDFRGETGYICDDGDADGKECDYNTIVYTTDLYSTFKVFACINDAGVDDSWVAIDLEFCPDSDFKDRNSHPNAEIKVWDTSEPIQQNTHGVVQQPCIKHNCKDGYPLNTAKNECTSNEPESETFNVECSQQGLQNAKKCGCRRNTDGTTTCYVTECDTGYKFGDPIHPDPNNPTWKNKYKDCIEDPTYTGETEIAAATTTTTTTASEPRDEYADIIKKIENEISEYSKKCSKYTKPQAK